MGLFEIFCPIGSTYQMGKQRLSEVGIMLKYKLIKAVALLTLDSHHL